MRYRCACFTVAFAVVVLAAGCGPPPEDECSSEGEVKCEDGKAYHCREERDVGGGLAMDGLRWQVEECTGETPVCVTVETGDWLDNRAFCSATAEPVCQDGYVEVDGTCFSCNNYGYPEQTRDRQLCERDV